MTGRSKRNSYYATLAGESPRFGGPFAPAGSALTAIGSAGESALRVSARGESRQLTRPRDAASHPEQPSHQVTSQQTVPTIRQKIDTSVAHLVALLAPSPIHARASPAAARAALFDHEEIRGAEAGPTATILAASFTLHVD